MTSSSSFPSAPRRVATTAALAAAVAGAFLAAPAVAANPALNYSSWAQAWGNLSFQYSSQLLGNVSFSVNGPGDYKSDPQYQCSNTTCGYVATGDTGLASASYTIATGAAPGQDPVYDLLTSNGQYGFSYDAQARTAALRLHTKSSASTVDAAGQSTSSPNTSLNTSAYAGWSTQLYIAPTATRPAGSYGAILVGMQLDGNFGTVDPTGSSWASQWASSSFTDAAGVSYSSSFSIGTGSYDPNWTGSSTVFKKLLFQFGTPFSIGLTQQVSSSVNGTADFSNTGFISFVQLPFGATLDSGAQQAGLGSASQLFGNVVQSTTADDPNTNWDFGNNGGGFTPPPAVPEAETWAMLLAGLGVMAWLSRRRVTA